MAGFDFEGARAAGYNDSEILDYLRSKDVFKFDYENALKSGYAPSEIVNYLAQSPNNPRSVSSDVQEAVEGAVGHAAQAIQGNLKTTLSDAQKRYLARLGISLDQQEKFAQEHQGGDVVTGTNTNIGPNTLGIIQAPNAILTSPVQGLNRHFISRPLSNATGLPISGIENTENAILGTLGAAAGFKGALGGPKLETPTTITDPELEADVTKRYDALRANNQTIPADAAKTAANTTASKVYGAGVGDPASEQMLGRIWKTASAQNEVPVRSIINLHKDIIASNELHPVAQAIMAKDLQGLLQEHAPEAALQNLEAADSYKALLASRTIENAQQRAQVSGDTTGNYLTQLRAIARNPLDPTKSNTFRERMTPQTQQMLDDIVMGRTGGAKSTAVGRTLGGDRGLGSIIGPWIAESATRHLTGIPLLGGIVGGVVGRLGTEIGNQALKGSIQDLGDAIRAGTPLGRTGPSTPWGPSAGPPSPLPMLPAPGRPIGAPATPGGVQIPPAPPTPAGQIATTSGLPINRGAPSIAQPGRISGAINLLDQIARGPTPIPQAPQRLLPPPAPPGGPSVPLPGPQAGPPIPQPGTTVSPGSLNPFANIPLNPFANIPSFIKEVPKLRDANGRFIKKKK